MEQIVKGFVLLPCKLPFTVPVINLRISVNRPIKRRILVQKTTVQERIRQRFDIGIFIDGVGYRIKMRMDISTLSDKTGLISQKGFKILHRFNTGLILLPGSSKVVC